MTEHDVAEADRLGRLRLWLCFLMAAAFLGSLIFGQPDHAQGAWRIAWGLLAVLLMLNLSGLKRGGLFRPHGVRRLLEDETTRDHRRTSQSAGFWAAMAAGLMLWGVDGVQPIPGALMVQVIVTAGVTAALLAFAVQERRALGDA